MEGGMEGGRESQCVSSWPFHSIKSAWRTCIPTTKSRAERQAAIGLVGRREGGREGEVVSVSTFKVLG